MKAKEILKKTGGWICKNKNIFIYAAGLSGVVWSCMDMGKNIGYKYGTEDGVHSACSLAEEIQPGMRKKMWELAVKTREK